MLVFTTGNNGIWQQINLETTSALEKFVGMTGKLFLFVTSHPSQKISISITATEIIACIPLFSALACFIFPHVMSVVCQPWVRSSGSSYSWPRRSETVNVPHHFNPTYGAGYQPFISIKRFETIAIPTLTMSAVTTRWDMSRYGCSVDPLITNYTEPLTIFLRNVGSK